MLSFSSATLQKRAAQLDDWLFSLFNRNTTDKRSPIFINSLARGGTTAVLNAFHDLPDIATHTYRDMPLIAAPYLWSRVSNLLNRRVSRTQRAHGDGIEIDLDSPEAFDEVYWKLYWPEHYKNKQIALWTSDDENTMAKKRLEECFRKITYIRRRNSARYLSKNNANIARLSYIPQAFPGTHLIVPVRRPAPHASSLLRQHLNFTKLQTEDEFVRRYMRDIGHLEFGLLHQPIAFENFDRSQYIKEDPDYWLSYWIAANREIFSHSENCQLILQDDLRRNPNSCMNRLLENLNIEGPLDFTRYFPATPDVTDESVFSPELLIEANTLYERISRLAVR